MPTTLARITAVTICLCFALLNDSNRAYGEEFVSKAEKGAYGLSLNYPGGGIKY